MESGNSNHFGVGTQAGRCDSWNRSNLGYARTTGVFDRKEAEDGLEDHLLAVVRCFYKIRVVLRKIP